MPQPENGQVQLGARARARGTPRAAFASETSGSMNYPFAMLFHVELA